MTTARNLLCKHVVMGHPEERLSDLAERMSNNRAHHCVVVSEKGDSFLGMVRIVDLARWTNPGLRILADLVSPVPPLSIGADEPAGAVIDLFERHSLGEAAVFEANGQFVGLVTASSVLEWFRTDSKGGSAWLGNQPRDGVGRSVLLHPILDQCIGRARGLLSAKRLFLSTAWAADNDRVLGEQAATIQAFRGIFERAILVAPIGGRLRIETRASEGKYCQVSVFSASESLGAAASSPVSLDEPADNSDAREESITTLSFALYRPQAVEPSTEQARRLTT